MSDKVKDGKSDISLFGEADPLVGSVVDGRWEIETFLGEGSLSGVYRARDKTQNREVKVLKRVHPHLMQNIKNIKRFETKCRGLFAIKGNNVASYKDVVVASDGNYFLVMDEMNFESLEDLLSKSGHISVERAVSIFKQVCLGLEQGEAAGFQHRDMKPSNIVIVDNAKFVDDVKVIDFGVAK